MKNIFILILTLSLSASLFAQGNLQFNQIRKIDITGNQSYQYNYNTGNTQMNFATQTITVPTGKVLKIESSFVRMTYSGTNNEAKPLTGTNGSIVNTPASYAPNTSNVFKFGITNNSETSQTINYGYIKLS